MKLRSNDSNGDPARKRATFDTKTIIVILTALFGTGGGGYLANQTNSDHDTIIEIKVKVERLQDDVKELKELLNK